MAGQANLASEQQQLLTLATNIGEQFATQQSALNQATKGLTGSQKIIAQVDQSTGLAAQLSAEGQAAQVLIGTLHGNGVAGIEYIDVGRALENAGDNRAALAYYNDAVTAPPRDVVTIGTALRDAGYLEYSLGLTRAGHQDMMRAVAVFRGRQLYIPKYALANDIAQGYYGDADEELTSSTPPGCAAASADMAAGNRVLAPVGGISGAQSANIELFDTATLADKAHCHLPGRPEPGRKSAGGAASRAGARPATFVCMFEAAGVLEGLNDEQRQAATHAGGPLLVLAGAGTGKTGTLVARAAWLRAQGVEASRILLLTFTRRAADDMLARVARGRRRLPRDRICGGTFHAVAHQIIRAHAESFSLPPAFSVIDPADVADVLDALRADHDLVGTQRRAPRAAGLRRHLHPVREHPDHDRRGGGGQLPLVPRVHRGSWAGCSAATSRTSAGTRLVDFDDLLLLWRAALADPAAGPVLRGMFDAVLVDEYQDVNAVQAEIVRLLRPDGHGPDLCRRRRAGHLRVPRRRPGAPAGARPSAYPGLTVIRLVRNYRSKDAVLRLANTVRPQSDGPGAGADRRSAAPGCRPQLVRCHDEATQAREICARVLDAHEAGRTLRDQAVLMRAAGPQRRAGGRAVGARHPVHQVRRAAVHRGGARQGLPGRGARGGQPGRRHRLVPAAPAARGDRPGASPGGSIDALRLADPHRSNAGQRRSDASRPGPGMRWPRRWSALAGAAALDRTADRAAAILAALDDPLRARYPDAGVAHRRSAAAGRRRGQPAVAARRPRRAGARPAGVRRPTWPGRRGWTTTT